MRIAAEECSDKQQKACSSNEESGNIPVILLQAV